MVWMIAFSQWYDSDFLLYTQDHMNLSFVICTLKHQVKTFIRKDVGLTQKQSPSDKSEQKIA